MAPRTLYDKIWDAHVVDEQDGEVPDCAGDIRVEFRHDPDNTVSIFSGCSYYFARAA